MKILVIGHSVIDSINNELKPGGIYYSVQGLINYACKNDEISLITSVSDNTYSYFKNLYSKINSKYIQKVMAIPTVQLKLFEYREREEHYLNITDKLEINRDINFEMFDGILINMITGFDIDLEDLKFIRSRFNGPIYFDVHTFSRSLDNDNKRNFRLIPNAAKWLSQIDILQANQHEILTLSNKNKLDNIISDILDSMIKLLIITKGDEGAIIYFKENLIIKSFEVNSIKINAVNSIGCGDIFGAVFFYSYIMSRDIEISLKTANAAAGVSTKYNSFNEYNNLKEDANRFID